MTNLALPSLRPFRMGFSLLATAGLLVACNSGQDRETNVQALPPASQAVDVESEGARFSVLAYEDRGQAGSAFGFDIRGAGLLPVRIGIENRSGGALRIIPRQTFLIDHDGQAWPLLTSDQAFSRLGSAGFSDQGAPRLLDELDALSGFAVDVLPSVAGSGSEKRIGQNLAEKKLRNRKIAAGEWAFGALFFPGRMEAENARGLRLCYEQEGRVKYLNLPLKPSLPLTSAK